MAGVITARTGSGGFPLEAGYRNGFLVLSGVAVIGAKADLARVSV